MARRRHSKILVESSARLLHEDKQKVKKHKETERIVFTSFNAYNKDFRLRNASDAKREYAPIIIVICDASSRLRARARALASGGSGGSGGGGAKTQAALAQCRASNLRGGACARARFHACASRGRRSSARALVTRGTRVRP